MDITHTQQLILRQLTNLGFIVTVMAINMLFYTTWRLFEDKQPVNITKAALMISFTYTFVFMTVHMATFSLEILTLQSQ